MSKEKLRALKKQEQFFKRRIEQLNRQNKAVKKLEDFVALAKNLGVTDDRWDDFSVNLSEESMSFQSFEAMLEQTHNSAQYYFLPVHLDLRLANIENNESSSRAGNADADEKKADTAPQKTKAFESGGGGDLVINLRGAYLIRN